MEDKEKIAVPLKLCRDFAVGDASGYRIMELNDDVYNVLLKNGQCVLRGGADDDAVLCTSKTSYGVKFFETSNTMLLVSSDMNLDGASSKPVLCGARGIYELVLLKPDMTPLLQLLRANPYKGVRPGSKRVHDKRADCVCNGVSMDEILNVVQASENEICDALSRLHAMCIDCRYYSLDPIIEGEILDMILSVCQEKQMAFKAVDVAEEEIAIRHVLSSFGTNRFADGKTWCELDDKAVCRHRAAQILQASERWGESEFVNAWEQACPDPLRPTLSMLQGMVVAGKEGARRVLRYVDTDALPFDFKDVCTRGICCHVQRLSVLFRLQANWMMDELVAFMTYVMTLSHCHCRPVVQPGDDVTKLVTKYCYISNNVCTLRFPATLNTVTKPLK